MRLLPILCLVSILPFLTSCGTTTDLPTVDKVELEQYAGTWHEIAKLPNKFQRGLDCVTATYTLKENGKIEVFNKGREVEKQDEWKEITGSARVPKADYPGRLKVTFFWPFAGDYYIIELDEGYQYALVGDPSRKFLWILAREPQLPESKIAELLARASELGFDTDAVTRTNQSCYLEGN
jgi:lipocalin